MKLAALALALLSVGCATHRHGRLLPLTDAERQALTCEQLDLEIAKAVEFIAGVEKGPGAGKATLGILGDFGIGNGMERQDALRSGRERLFDLQVHAAAKGCPNATGPTIPDPRRPRANPEHSGHKKPGP